MIVEQSKQASSANPDRRPEAGSWAERLRRPGFLCLLLALATLIVFLPVAHQGFVNYDDSDYVTDNTHVQSGLKWANIVWAFTTGHASNWHPLTWLSHMLDAQLFGQRAGPQHLVSVGFHIANTLLLFLLLQRMTGARWRSALVAALFGLHPLHVESVAWASERKDVLSAFFFMLTLGAYVRYAEARSPKAEGRIPEAGGGQKKSEPGSPYLVARANRLPAMAWYVLALFLFLLGLMSKPMLVTLPFVLLLLDYWPLRRFELDLQKPMRKRLLLLIVEKLPFLALAAASSVITFIVQRKGGAVSTSISVGARIANALVSYVRYLGKMFWPLDLSILYPHPGHWAVWQTLAAAALLLVISVAVFLLARRRPYLAVGWLWFLGTLIPVIGLIQVGIQSMADRYMYIPIIGLLIMLVWGIDELVPAWPWRGKALAAASAVALAACAGLTVRQVHFWRDSEALFRHAVQVTRDNYLAYNNLGFYLSGLGRTAEAMEYYRSSLKINPAYEDALNNLGYALAGQKKYAEAIPLYEAALRIRPNHAEVNNNLGNALSETGKIDEAIKHYLIALQQNPDHADAHNNLGIALAMKGKLDEAIQEYRESLRLKPDDAQAHNNLGNALAEQGKVGEAVGHYEEALRLNADNPEAHFNLALALLREGKREEAVTHLAEALRLKPDYAAARDQLKALQGR